MMTPEISSSHLEFFTRSGLLKSPVRLNDRTWLLEVALARTSMAVLMRGTLSSAEMTAVMASTSGIVRMAAFNILIRRSESKSQVASSKSINFVV